MNKAKVMEVLRQVEWIGGLGDPRGCPWCGAWEGDGHRDDCKLAVLLSAANKIEKTKLRLVALKAIADTAHTLRTQANMRRVVHSNADYIPAYLLGPLRDALDDLDALNEEE